MIKRKSELLQIRLETELLERFKAMAEHESVTVSDLLRNVMNHVCTNFETAQWRKSEHAKRVQERKR